jgi:hypothetical protein
MSHARPHAASLLRKVEPSTENGRAELSSVTVGGGPPRFPADAQTPELVAKAVVVAVEEESIEALVVLVALVSLVFLVFFPFSVFLAALPCSVAALVASAVVAELVVVGSVDVEAVVTPAPATLHQSKLS